jgi:IstB-like ATP binding protein
MKLFGMVEAVRRHAEDPEISRLSFEERLALLVDHQWDWRQNKALARRLKNARFKLDASVEDIDYRHPRRLDRQLIRSLSSSDWVRLHHNLLITGPCGVGKSYMACALAQKAVRDGFTALYFRAPRLFRDLSVARADGGAASANSWTVSRALTSLLWMIGPWLHWPTANAATFWKSVMTAIRFARRFSPARYPSLIGTIKLAIRPLPTASWIVWFITHTGSSWPARRYGNLKTANRLPTETTRNDRSNQNPGYLGIDPNAKRGL